MSTQKTNSLAGLAQRVRRRVPASLVRYGIVGVAQNGGFYLVALLLIALGWQAWQVVLVLNPIAVMLTFLLNRSWSFAGRTRAKGQFWRYVAVYGLAYPFAVGFTWVLEHLGVTSWLAVLINVFVCAVGIYAALNIWVFGKSMPERPEDGPSSE